MAQFSPILSPSHFPSRFLILCRYFLLFFLLHSRRLGLVVMPGRLSSPSSSDRSSSFWQWFPRLFRIREQGQGVRASEAPWLHCLHSRGLCLQRLWPVAPLFHWRSCVTYFRTAQCSSGLDSPFSYFIWVSFAGLSPLLGDPRSAMLLTAAGAVAQPSMTTLLQPQL